MEIRALGPLELVAGGEPVELRRGRPRRLLLALLVRDGGPASSERLVEELWKDQAPQNATNALQVLVSYLRKVLTDDADDVRIETTGNGYRLVAPRSQVDLHRFEDLVADATAAPDPVARLAMLDEALGLWRGPALTEAGQDEFADGLIVHLDELRLQAIEVRVDALLATARHREVVGELRRLVGEHPLRERFHAQLVLALYRSDRQADALRAFDDVRILLLDELGLDPGPELQALHRAVLEQSPDLALHGSTAPAPVVATGAPPTTTVSSPPVDAASVWARPVAASSLTTRPRTRHRADPLVGRDGVVDQLLAMLDDHRLVTLSGTGGAGKTRLADEVAARVADGGTTAWWVDLSGADDLDTVVAAVALATGAATPPDDPSEALVTHLAAQAGVLVLDTCEHVVDEVAPLVAGVLDRGDGVAVLATSRRPLRVPDERVWPVLPLELPDPQHLDADAIAEQPAVRLFTERARAVRSDFRLTEANAEAVGRICLLLDGVPLALELAAVQLATFSPARLLRLLDDRLRVLVDDSLTGRQQAVRTTIEWSYRLLAPDEQRYLARLSTFAGPFDVDAAVVVAGHDLERDGYDLLLSLTRQSLVALAPDDRFRLLDTIRAFATEQLEAGDGIGEHEAEDARTRHARWYADLAVEADQHLRGADAEGWLAELRREQADLRAALAWSFGGGDPAQGIRLAAGLAWFWGIEGLFAEARRWLDTALAAVDEGSVAHAALLTGQSIHEASLGDLELAAAHSQQAADIYDVAGDRRGLARALLYRGVALWGLGRLGEAADAHDRCAATFHDLGDDAGYGLALMLRGRTAVDREEPDVADRLDAALAVSRRGGDSHVIGLCLDQRARVAVLDGDLDLAVTLAKESLAANDAAGYVEGSIASMHALGLALAAQGDLAESDRLHRAGLRLAVGLDHPGAIAEGLECLAKVTAAAGDPATALTLLAAADAVRRRRTVPRPRFHERMVEAARSRASADLGDDDAAARAVRAGGLLDVATFARADDADDPATAPS